MRIRNIALHLLMPAIAGIGVWYWILTQLDPLASPFFCFWDAVLNVIALVLGAKTLQVMLRYYRPSGTQSINLIIWILLFALAAYGISRYVLSFQFTDMHSQALLSKGFLLRVCINILILGCVSLISWVRYQSISDARSQARYQEIKQMAIDSELHALRQQLQPHFLFNSLNSIQTLIGIEPNRAKKMVLQLSDYLRGTLRRDNLATHNIHEELDNALLYLEIEKVRFGDRLHIALDTSQMDLEIAGRRSVPALILQPLVENAMKHGLYQHIGDVTIDIHVQTSTAETLFQVCNPFDPSAVGTSIGTGYGLSSLRRRLFLLYGRKDLVQTEDENQKFCVTLIIPNNESNHH